MSTRIENLDKRYEDVASVLRDGVEVQLADDPAGYRYSQAVRVVVRTAEHDGPEVWADVVGAAKSLRWKLLLHPEPDSSLILEHIDSLAEQVERIRPNVADHATLDEILEAAFALRTAAPAVGRLLQEAIEDFTAADCLVVAGSRIAAESISRWLAFLGSNDQNFLGARVLAAGDLRRKAPEATTALLVGPPRFFHSSMVTAPVTPEVTFLVPNWFGDRSIPATSLSEYAENPIQIRLHEKGRRRPEPLQVRAEVSEEPLMDQPDEAQLEPSVVWSKPQGEDKTPRPDEVRARKVLLCGGYSVWVDDGDRIRSLDPSQPVGENIVYLPVDAFRELNTDQLARTEIYLLLRSTGSSQHAYLHERAQASLGGGLVSVQTSQGRWKEKLRQRIDSWGEEQVIRSLEEEGVQAAGEAVSWTGEGFTRPLRNDDFRLMLEWLGFQPDGAEYINATRLRSAFRSESQKVQTQIGKSIRCDDLERLKQDSHITLPSPVQGEPGLTAARVLAVSPYDVIKQRHEVRVLRRDDSGRWLQ
ncbi:hypothetical protein [Cellulosimicrobium funkei]|uniref:hypothetical protein n=1 Tax=Cellulosimicrobium funkei TaxID=264251 RepID=UPI00341CCB6F